MPPAHVAVDNATGDPFDLAAGSVYVAEGAETKDREVQRQRGTGRISVAPRNAKKKTKKRRVGANTSKATKLPVYHRNGYVRSISFGDANGNAPTSIAVDQEGNIYAMDPTYNGDASVKPEGAVVEFNPKACLCVRLPVKKTRVWGTTMEGGVWATAPRGCMGWRSIR